MESTQPYRPRVSRETRLLLTAGLLAVAALWLLARIRFPERPVTPNPVPAVLSQLASSPKFAELAGEVAQLQARLQPSLLAVGRPPTSRNAFPALRLRDDLAIAWIPAEDSRPSNTPPIVARDAASGLAVIRVPMSTPPPPIAWALRQPYQSRFLFASDASPEDVSLRPVYVGAIESIENALWLEPLWAVPRRTDVDAGSLLFTNGAEFAGLVIPYRGELVLVPGTTVLAEAERLLATQPASAGTIGVEVQALTPPVAAATGASIGVVVTWVDPDGAGEERVKAGDVVEALEGRPVTSKQLWDVRMARLSAGEAISLRVRRRLEVREVSIVATAAALMETETSAVKPSLGLTLRRRPNIGAEVVRVVPGSAADRAGLFAGDVITLIDDIVAPTHEQVLASYTTSARSAPLIVAVTRGDAHFVTTFER